MKKLCMALAAFAMIMSYTLEASALNDCRKRVYTTAAALLATTPKDCTTAYAVDKDMTFIRKNSVWEEVPSYRPSATYTLTFDAGANLGFGAAQLDGTAAQGAVGISNMGFFEDGQLLITYIGGNGGTIVPTKGFMIATGLDLSADAADNEGYSLVGGMLGASGRPFVTGRDPAFKACINLDLTDASDTDDLHFGFRSAEEDLPIDDYNDVASIGIITSANPAAIQLATATGAGAMDETDTTDTWADGADKDLCVLVSAAGAVTYTIEGAAPTSTVAFSFADNVLVVPFFQYIHDGNTDLVPVLASWQVAWQ